MLNQPSHFPSSVPVQSEASRAHSLLTLPLIRQSSSVSASWDVRSSGRVVVCPDGRLIDPPSFLPERRQESTPRCRPSARPTPLRRRSRVTAEPGGARGGVGGAGG